MDAVAKKQKPKFNRGWLKNPKLPRPGAAVGEKSQDLA